MNKTSTLLRYNSSRRLLNNAQRSFVSTCPYATDPEKLKSKYDVVIIGAGHNGLVAANYLAKFSKKKLNICLLERRHVIGGAAVTEELTPGFKFSRASYLLSLFRPMIIKDLDLMRHGMLKYYTRNPSSYTPLAQTDSQYSAAARRTSLTLGPDMAFNKRELSKFSTKDAENYEKYEHWMGKICEVLEAFLDLPPPAAKEFGEKSLIEKLKYAKSYIKDYDTLKFYLKNFEDIYRLFTEPAANILDEWFESDVLKASLATDSVIGAMLSPYSSGSGYVLLHHIIGGVEGQKGVWAYVEGGMGTISNCLAKNAKCFQHQGEQLIDIFVSQEVKKIEIIDEKLVKGVTLESGKFIECDYLLSNCTPELTFNRFMQDYNFDKSRNEELAAFFKRVKNINYDSGTMKINLAVRSLPNFLADSNNKKAVNDGMAMPHHRTTIHLNCENMKIIHDAYEDVSKFGRMASKKPVIEMVIPSSLDPTLAPKGSHVILLFCQYFSKSDDNLNEKENYAQLVLNSIEQYAPGFKDSIIYKDVLAPSDLEKVFGLTGGNIFHGALPLSQLFINRPVSGWSNYRTPIENLYLCGAGAHPGGGVMGTPGRLAALELIKSIK